MRRAALAAIGIYQRYVSPYKGFCCSYRLHTGRASCSALGARVIRRWGVWRGLAVLRLRLHRCGEIHRHCAPTRNARPVRALAAQRGECDPGCDLDLGAADGCCDVADVCSCDGCDWPSRKSRVKPVDRKRKPDELRSLYRRFAVQIERLVEVIDTLRVS